MSEPSSANADSITIEYDCTPAERRQASQIISLGLAGRATRVPGGNVKAEAGKVGRGLAGWVLFVILALIFVYLLAQGTPVQSSAPRLLEAPYAEISTAIWMNITLVIIGGLFVVVGFVFMSKFRRTAAKMWKRPTTFTFDPTGVTKRRAGRTDAFSWERLPGFSEGIFVFVLRTEPRRGVVIPKRLFANENECDRFRELLRTCAVRKAIPLAMGFEVKQ